MSTIAKAMLGEDDSEVRRIVQKSGHLPPYTDIQKVSLALKGRPGEFPEYVSASPRSNPGVIRFEGEKIVLSTTCWWMWQAQCYSAGRGRPLRVRFYYMTNSHAPGQYVHYDRNDRECYVGWPNAEIRAALDQQIADFKRRLSTIAVIDATDPPRI